MRSTLEQPDENEHVAEWMRQLAATPVDGPPLPGAHVLWWKAEVSRRIDQAQHVTQPLNTGERVQIACAFGIAFALLGWLTVAAPHVWTEPLLALPVLVGGALLGAAAAFTAWDLRGPSHG
jgi:hypothetical protein